MAATFRCIPQTNRRNSVGKGVTPCHSIISQSYFAGLVPRVAVLLILNASFHLLVSVILSLIEALLSEKTPQLKKSFAICAIPK